MKKELLVIFLVFFTVPFVSALVVPDIRNIGDFYAANSSFIDFILITLFVVAAANITLENMYGRGGKSISILFGLMVGGAWAYYSAAYHVSLLGTYSAPFLIFLGALVFLFFYEIFKAHNIKASVPFILVIIVVVWLWLQKYIENGQLRFLQPVVPWGNVIMILSLLLLMGYVVMMFRGGEGLPSGRSWNVGRTIRRPFDKFMDYMASDERKEKKELKKTKKEIKQAIERPLKKEKIELAKLKELEEVGEGEVREIRALLKVAEERLKNLEELQRRVNEANNELRQTPPEHTDNPGVARKYQNLVSYINQLKREIERAINSYNQIIRQLRVLIERLQEESDIPQLPLWVRNIDTLVREVEEKINELRRDLETIENSKRETLGELNRTYAEKRNENERLMRDIRRTNPPLDSEERESIKQQLRRNLREMKAIRKEKEALQEGESEEERRIRTRLRKLEEDLTKLQKVKQYEQEFNSILIRLNNAMREKQTMIKNSLQLGFQYLRTSQSGEFEREIRDALYNMRRDRDFIERLEFLNHVIKTSFSSLFEILAKIRENEEVIWH